MMVASAAMESFFTDTFATNAFITLLVLVGIPITIYLYVVTSMSIKN